MTQNTASPSFSPLPNTPPPPERFVLVSTLYGPGNMLCWFCLMLSVLISWTLNPKHTTRDSITNDFVALLSLPIVSVAHFLHQVYYQYTSANTNMKSTGAGALSSLLLDTDNTASIERVAAIEAPLTVCEDFIALAAILHFFALRRNHTRRIVMVEITAALCLAIEFPFLVDWVPFSRALFVRPFFFHHLPFFFILLAWQGLTFLCYLVEVAVGAVAWAVVTGPVIQDDAELGRGRGLVISLRPKKYSSWMSGVSAVMAGVGSFWIKYCGLYWVSPGTNVARFVPLSTVSITELDQAVAAVGGLVTLGFSVHSAYKERRKRLS